MSRPLYPLARPGSTFVTGVVGDGRESVSQGPTGMYYEAQPDWSDIDWIHGLHGLMSRD